MKTALSGVKTGALPDFVLLSSKKSNRSETYKNPILAFLQVKS
jgi:hypothetical protein